MPNVSISSFTVPANTVGVGLTGYSLTGSNAQPMFDLSGTWNTTGTPTALKLNITDTASNASSLLMDLQVGGSSKFTVSPLGTIGFGPFGSLIYFFRNNSGWLNIESNGYQYYLTSTGFLAFNSAQDLYIGRDAANTLAQRNALNAQTFRLYNTFTSATNFQRLGVTSASTTLSALSGASVTATGLIPAGAVVVGVTTRVSTEITGATGYQVGTVADPDRWGDITGVAVGTTSDNTNWTAGTIECFTAASDVVITAKTSNFTAGAIVVVIHYLIGQAD